MRLFSYVLFAIFAVNVSAATVLTCKSKDFNADNYDGQALQVTFNKSGEVTKIDKMTGSWFCDEKTADNPKLLKRAQNYSVYEANFECDEWNGRLIVPADLSKPMKYQFSWADDERNRRDTSLLYCE